MNSLIKFDGNEVLEKISQEIRDLIESKQEVPEPIFLKAPSYFSMAAHTGNCHYAEMGTVLCRQNNFEPTKTMLEIISAAALTRCFDSSRGTKAQIDRENQNTAVKTWMAHLIATGCTQKEASEKTATLYQDSYPNEKPKKASSISKLYESEFKNIKPFGVKTNQQIIDDMHTRDANLQLKWQLIARNTCSREELKGNRRE